MSKEDKQEYINNAHDKQIEALQGHARVANEEMGVIKTDMALVKQDMSAIKKWADSLDYKIWALITLVVAAVLRIYIK